MMRWWTSLGGCKKNVGEYLFLQKCCLKRFKNIISYLHWLIGKPNGWLALNSLRLKQLDTKINTSLKCLIPHMIVPRSCCFWLIRQPLQHPHCQRQLTVRIASDKCTSCITRYGYLLNCEFLFVCL